MIKIWEKELRKLALKNFDLKKKKLKKLKIVFKDKKSKRVLGSYSSLEKTIYINKDIYQLSGEKYFYIFRHEYGHFLTDLLFKGVNPHGVEWKNIMRILGDEKPRATTSLFSSEVRFLKLNKRRKL